MENYVVLFLLNHLLFLVTSIATEIFFEQVSRLSNFVTYCHVLFNRYVLLFLSVHRFVLSISVMSLMSFQLEVINEFTRPSESKNFMLCVGSFINATDFQQNKLSSICNSWRVKYFVSMQLREFLNIIKLIRKL